MVEAPSHDIYNWFEQKIMYFNVCTNPAVRCHTYPTKPVTLKICFGAICASDNLTCVENS